MPELARSVRGMLRPLQKSRNPLIGAFSFLDRGAAHPKTGPSERRYGAPVQVRDAETERAACETGGPVPGACYQRWSTTSTSGPVAPNPYRWTTLRNVAMSDCSKNAPTR
jgi:hypothetical protein